MIFKDSVQMLKKNIILTLTISIITQLVEKYLFKFDKNIFDQDWMKNTFATIIGFAFHDFFTYKINNMIDLKGVQAEAFSDILYYGTMMIVKEYVLAEINDSYISSNKFKTILISLTGFVVYDLLVNENQLKLDEKYNDKTHDAFAHSIKLITAILVSDFIHDKTIEIQTFPYILSLLLALPVFHLGTFPILIGK